MHSDTTDGSDYRCERKYVLSALSEPEIESFVKRHPAMFHNIYYPRYVNSLYLDTVDLRNYWDNLRGANNRMKIRIRWYGQLFNATIKPVLEFKIKNGWMNRKMRFPLSSFPIASGIEYRAFSNLLKSAELPKSLRPLIQSLTPVVLVRYNRSYLVSAGGQFRITIDSDLEYYRALKFGQNFVARSKDGRNTVLELKYMSRYADRAERISNYFPFRLSKSSKYLSGIARFDIV